MSYSRATDFYFFAGMEGIHSSVYINRWMCTLQTILGMYLRLAEWKVYFVGCGERARWVCMCMQWRMNALRLPKIQDDIGACIYMYRAACAFVCVCVCIYVWLWVCMYVYIYIMLNVQHYACFVFIGRVSVIGGVLLSNRIHSCSCNLPFNFFSIH